MNTTESRREFEEWAESIGYAVERYGISDLYMGNSVPVSWEAWQAARDRQWLKIESAPKDGTEIICLEDNDIYKAAWSKDEFWLVYCGQPVVIGIEPTHWMPLPPNPPAN